MNYVRLLVMILFISIASNITVAQQITTAEPNSATFDSNQLNTVFQNSYGESGPVELFGIVRGQRISIGKVSGTITAEPPSRIKVMDGTYRLVKDGVSLVVSGDMTIVKSSLTNRQYPIITLNSGTVQLLETKLECIQPACNLIVIDTDTRTIGLNGKAKIYGKIGNREQYLSIAKDIELKPISISEELRSSSVFASQSINLLIAFTFKAVLLPDNRVAQMGIFKLKDGSEGIYTQGFVGNQYLVEGIKGNIEIMDILSESEREDENILSSIASIQYDEPGTLRNILEPENIPSQIILRSGIFFLPLSSNPNNAIIDSCATTLGCIIYSPEHLLITPSRQTNDLPIKATVNLDNNRGINNVNIGKFSPNDNLGQIVIEKPSLLGNRKMIFSGNNVLIDGDWKDFGISFWAYMLRSAFLSGSDNQLALLECMYNHQNPRNSICTFDGRPITYRQESLSCNSNEDCNGEESCVSNRCIQRIGCRKILGNGNPNNIDFLIVGENTHSTSEIESIVTGNGNSGGLLFGSNGFFRTEPFNNYQNKFNIWVKTSPEMRIQTSSIGNSLNAEDIDLSDCPNAEFISIVSNKDIRSSSQSNIMPCISLISLSDGQTIGNRILIHEFAHCFGNLADEYVEIQQDKTGRPRYPNCIVPERNKDVRDVALEKWSRLLCNRPEECPEAERIISIEAAGGCGGICDTRCNAYLRPSQNSIMRTGRLSGEFNLISKTALIKKLREWNS